MDDITKRLKQLTEMVAKAKQRLNLDQQADKLADLTKQSQQPDFWVDSAKAQTIMKEQARLQSLLEPWQQLQGGLDDLSELALLKDATLQTEIGQQLTKLEQQFEGLKEQLRFSGPYDDHDAFLSIFAGAGGTDAQDWTQMLLRMYLRWAEKHGFKVQTLAESAGEEAGLKSVTIGIDGSFVFGQLKGEHGVHRLVRLSPFNADNLRQTSFAKVEVMPKISRPDELIIDDKDLKVDVFRSGGHGGQSVNTTDSAVRLTHIPTGLTVSIQNERSQIQNKETAMSILRSRLAQLQLEQHKEKLDELKGPNQSAEWGNQIRSYVLHPYKQVKDLRSKYESSDPEAVLDGALDEFIKSSLD